MHAPKSTTRRDYNRVGFAGRFTTVLTLILAFVLLTQANQQTVIPGIEVLLSEQLTLIRGKRVGFDYEP